jgi:hypothetical protein
MGYSRKRVWSYAFNRRIMFDALDEKYRWCIYCKADCWLELENQRHDKTCPFETGLFPVDSDTIERGGCCGQCSTPFELDDFEMNVDMKTGEIVSKFEPYRSYEIVCVGCATAIKVLGVKYE